MTDRKPRTWGTHNTLDGKGRTTFFADVVGYCEAIEDVIEPAVARKNRLMKRRQKARRAGIARGYRMLTCARQRDLVMVFNRFLYKYVDQEYVRVHGGVAKVTPARGEWAVTLRERQGVLRRPTGDLVTFVWGHRVNAAFPPYIRGEATMRSEWWQMHNEVSNDLIEKYREMGHRVRAGGDANTPKHRVDGRWIMAYRSLPHEIGKGEFDRLGSSDPMVDHDVLSAVGSDHMRVRATA